MSPTLPLSGVALRTHPDGDYPARGMAPYAHQQRLRELFQQKAGFVAVNDSPTGGGKTMSWLAPVVESGEHTIAVYPTNALIADQHDNVKSELAERFPEYADDVTVHQITAATLSREYADKYSDASSNGQRLKRLLYEEIYQTSDPKQVIVLTNPDILVMMRRHLYGGGTDWDDPADRIRTLNEFTTAVVDEFHRADRKEQNTLLFLLDEMYDLDERYCGLSRLVFLSATPEKRLERRFDEAMSAPYHLITEETPRDELRPFGEEPLDGNHRSVMPPVDLDVRSSKTFGTADVLLGDDWEETAEFCERPGETVIILDGIHEVQRVYDRLRAEYPNRAVRRIDGFHRGDLQEKLKDPGFDILVSNSAVEVGIDFDVERLIFSGHHRDSFLQRLGRLRTEEQVQAARCYIPRWPADDLETFASERDDRVSRSDLVFRLDEVYDDPREPESFDWRYSAAEAWYHTERRMENAVSSDENSVDAETIQREGEERILRHFVESNGKLTIRDVRRAIETVDEETRDALQWYRGDSVQALVHDTTEEADDELKAYDLFYLLRYGDVTFYEKSKFKRHIPSKFADEVDRFEEYVVGFCEYDGPIPTTEEGYGRNVAFKPTPMVRDWLNDTPSKPREIRGLSVDATPQSEEIQPRIDPIEPLRSGLEDEEILCFPERGTTRKVKNQYGLGSFFFLYPLEDTRKNWTLALGTDALYLHCHAEEEEQKFEGLGQ